MRSISATGGHVAVFLGHPDHRLAAFGLLHQFQAVRDPGAQGLLDQDVGVGGQGMAQHIDVGVVGRGDHQRIESTLCEQVLVVLEGTRGPGDQCLRGRPAGSVRIGDGGDLGAVERLDVLDVFAAMLPQPISA